MLVITIILFPLYLAIDKGLIIESGLSQCLRGKKLIDILTVFMCGNLWQILFPNFLWGGWISRGNVHHLRFIPSWQSLCPCPQKGGPHRSDHWPGHGREGVVLLDTVTIKQKEYSHVPQPLSHLCNPTGHGTPEPPIFFLLSHHDHSRKHYFPRQLCHLPSFPAPGASKAGSAFPCLTGQGPAHPPLPFHSRVSMWEAHHSLLLLLTLISSEHKHGGYLGSASSRRGHLGVRLGGSNKLFP